MSITITCACGTPLRARKTLARRWSVCPVCGLSVDLSPPDPARRNAAPPADTYVLAPPTPVAGGDPTPPRPDPTGRPQRGEGHSRSAGRMAPDGIWAALLWLPAGLTLLTAVFRSLWLEDAEDTERWFLVLLAAPVLVALGYTYGAYQSLLSWAAAGGRAQRYWPGSDVARLARSARDGLLSFLAGPAVFALTGIFFWLEAGELSWLDELILAQLALATVAAWLLGFTAITLGGRPRDALPSGVVPLAWRLGRRGAIGILVGSAGILAHGLWAISLLEETHRSFGGWIALCVCWVSLLWWTAGVLYWLGRCWRHQPKPPV
jgi:hypothetical protein